MNHLGELALPLALLVGLALPGGLQAQSADPPPTDPGALFNDGDGGSSGSTASLDAGWPRWSWSGYGQFNYERFDFFANAQATTPERRSRLDLRRVVIEPGVRISPRWRFQAEIEFEHGGTGSAVEYETEEAGEFEAEIERGGEVILENAFLEYTGSPAVNWRVGEMTVPFGMLNTWHRPDQSFTIERSLAESALVPGTWHDLGVAFTGAARSTRYTLMLVRALDSSAFTGYGFVGEGSRQRLEYREANDLALVASVDHVPMPGVVVGGALYYGDSSGNRPRANLNASANVTLAEIHGRWERGPLVVRGEYLLGRLQNADRVTQANFNTFNATELGVSRTPVGSEARAFFIEAGYDVLSLLGARGDRLIVFARFDAYDTHAGTPASIAKNQRYDREAMTVGLNYLPDKHVVIKAEFSRRSNASATANRQDYAGLAVGFHF